LRRQYHGEYLAAARDTVPFGVKSRKHDDLGVVLTDLRAALRIMGYRKVAARVDTVALGRGDQ
jgi:hypothetical protein